MHAAREETLVFTSNELITIEQWNATVMKQYGRNEQRLDAIHPLNKRQRRVYSQNGEDGVIEEIFNRIGVTNKFCVEFGASDGSWLSNTANLRSHHNWKALLIEGDPRHANAEKNIVTEMVTAENINDVFAKYIVPTSFDLLSIDIDGNDFWVWKALSEDRFSARVVAIELNSGLPNHLPLTMRYDPTHRLVDGNFGANLRAMVRLARSKGYELATCVKWNAFFVRKNEFAKLGLPVEICEDELVSRYFIPDPFWLQNRDGNKRVWVNPFESVPCS